LIGASLGLAIKKLSPRTEVRLWARDDAKAKAAGEHTGADVASSDLQSLCEGVDLAVLCCPVESMPGLARSLGAWLTKECVVTDAGSVKGALVVEMEQILGPRYVGSHPMAGSEQSGLEAATAELFEGAMCLVTPTSGTLPEALAAVEALWGLVGGKTIRLTPDEHDRIIARVSHLPHVAAAALVQTVCLKQPGWQQLAGGGYRDTTRVAGGPSEMWKGILLANRKEIVAALGDYIEILQKLQQDLRAAEEKPLSTFLEEARAWRKQLPNQRLD